MGSIIPRIVIIVSCLTIAVRATTDTTAGHFFKSLEDSLRWDYRVCTGDTTTLTVKNLTAWSNLADSIISSKGYGALVKEYVEMTRRNVADIRPCEVAAWKINRDRDFQDIDALILENKQKRQTAEAESILVAKGIAKVKKRPGDFLGIPFKITKHEFQWCCTHPVFGVIHDEGAYIRIDSISIDNVVYTGAFYFDSTGKFSAYEIESYPKSSDSLDLAVRKAADILCTFFAHSLKSPPDHTLRVGFFDIVQGRLSILYSWTSKHTPVYIGLATFKYLYYAKAVVKPKN
jgi:hypothetical protein